MLVGSRDDASAAGVRHPGPNRWTLVARAGRAAVTAVATASVALLLATGWHLATGGGFVSVQSGSMAPAFPVGALAVTRPVADPAELGVGDVVMYPSTSGAGFTTHRIVGLAPDPPLAFVTKGDANPVADRLPLSAEAVVAQTVMSVPYLGRIADAARTPAGWLSMIVLPGLVIVGFEVRRIVRAVRSGAGSGGGKSDGSTEGGT